MADELVLSLDFELIEGDPPRFVDDSGRQNHAIGMVYSTAEPIGITGDGGGQVPVKQRRQRPHLRRAGCRHPRFCI